ncbi:MAG TPA: hypothetical protein VJH22_06925 [Candidatus Nanoarchaeia archaeon]|nr:hypothetical protein [Candidatus Nanoarchaeia archaeon]
MRKDSSDDQIHIARYSAIKTYTEKRLEEVYAHAQKFVAKLSLLIQD